MNRSIVPPSRLLTALLLLLVACVAPASAQGRREQGHQKQGNQQQGRQKGFPLEKGGMYEALHPNLPRPPLSPSWKDPDALQRGAEMVDRLIAKAGGWEAYDKLGGFRYDLLVTSKMNTGKGKNPWKVHHYEARLCHFNVASSGYVYSEWAKPSLTGPDFMREVKFDDVTWREWRGGYGRSDKAQRTARSNVRMERLTATMPFSLRSMGAKLAFVREEESEIGTLEVYAMQLADTMIINYYPWMVDEYGIVDEFHLIVDPSEDRVIQMRFAFPDSTVQNATQLRWWTMDFEGQIQLGESCVLPHKRYRWLEGWNEITDLWIEDVEVERIPPIALRRPWQTGTVYQMPYRCDFWDPPGGVPGLSGHGTGVDLPRRGEYPPGHPKYEGPLTGDEPAKEEDGEDSPN